MKPLPSNRAAQDRLIECAKRRSRLLSDERQYLFYNGQAKDDWRREMGRCLDDLDTALRHWIDSIGNK